MTQTPVEPRTAARDAGSGPLGPAGRSWLDRYSHISERGSSIPREVRGGGTTFMAMCYILLVVIGAMMTGDARHADWSDRAVAVPVSMAVALMPFTCSITAGVGAGVVSYTAVRAAQGRWREPGAFLRILTAVFTAYFALHPIEGWLGVS